MRFWAIMLTARLEEVGTHTTHERTKSKITCRGERTSETVSLCGVSAAEKYHIKPTTKKDLISTPIIQYNI